MVYWTESKLYLGTILLVMCLKKEYAEELDYRTTDSKKSWSFDPEMYVTKQHINESVKLGSH